MERHALSLTVNNRPGVLIRIALVYSRRGFNIDSLVVSESSNPKFSKMNIVAFGDLKTGEQIKKQLAKLIDVIHVTEHTESDSVQRELALFKLLVNSEKRPELLQLAVALNATVLEVGTEHVMVEIRGTSREIDNATQLFRSQGLCELIRTGKVMMAFGKNET